MKRVLKFDYLSKNSSLIVTYYLINVIIKKKWGILLLENNTLQVHKTISALVFLEVLLKPDS
jgi:hypothetical protein